MFTAVSRHLESLIVLNRAIERPSGDVDELSYLKPPDKGSWVTAEDVCAFLEEPSLYEAREV